MTDTHQPQRARDLDFDIDVIERAQHENGAFPAGAEFSQYQHCWLRDGAFIAHALDVAAVHAAAAGHHSVAARRHAAAARFHLWASRTVERLEPTVDDLIERRAREQSLGEFDFLPTRFTLDGAWENDGWPNFQLDGYGQWLWSLATHLRTGEHLGAVGAPSAAAQPTLPDGFRSAAVLTVRYLANFWDQPCYDSWEEHRSQLHTTTLASVHAGLRDIGPYLPEAADMARAAAAGAVHYIRDDCVKSGHLIKYVRNDSVDASLLWLAVPFEVFAAHDPIMVATAERIERELLGGGVRRYLADTYYGGGEWILLTAWLAWYWLRVGRRDAADGLLRWIEEQRDESGALPEQVPGENVHPRFLAFWKREWGPSAKPLLWSHAMVALVKAAAE